MPHDVLISYSSKHKQKADGVQGAFMAPKGDFSGQMWKAVPAGNGYFYLVFDSANLPGDP